MITRGDNPISGIEEDAIGRAAVAQGFAEQVLALDVSEGVVVGVLGAWGSGKTSFINLARPHLEAAGATILDFNPWMFSGAAQLVDCFFRELSAQLKLRRDLGEVGQEFEDYGEIFSGMGWVPVIGPWLERWKLVSRIGSAALKRRKEGASARRTRVAKALSSLKSPLIVVLDDIDRLTTSEIRDIFRLVRLTASFPNVIYLVAFDRARVERALEEEGIPGRDYLEKIIQVGIDLPAIPPEVLNREVFRAIDAALAGVEAPDRFDKELWPDVYMEVIRPLVRNLRDVRRFTAAIRGTVRGLEGQIALVDLLALEAVRVFLPDVFRDMHGAVLALTATAAAGSPGRSADAALKGQVDRLIESARERGEVVQALIRRLFPAAERHLGGASFGSDWKARWLLERRVAHEDVVRLYLERVAGEGLRTFADAEQAWGRMADAGEFDSFLRSLDVNRIEDVIAALEAFEGRFAAGHVVSGCTVLLNLLHDLPDRPRGMFELDKKLVVTRVVYRLLSSLKDQEAITDAVRGIFPALASYSAKLELTALVGYREHSGHKLIGDKAAAEFERVWRAEVRAAEAGALAAESELLWVLLLATREAGPGEDTPAVPDRPDVTLAVLRSSQREQLSQSGGSRAVRRTPRLAWDELVELYGAGEVLRKRIEELKAQAPDGADELLQLVDKYLGGWRPGRFDDD